MCFDPDVHPRREVLAALYTADVPRALAAAAEDTGSLQLTGDAILLAVQQAVEGAGDRARQLAAQLREREWPGDVELARELEPDTQAEPLTPLHVDLVDLDELADALDESRSVDPARIHLATGVIWTAPAIENSLDAGLDIEDLERDDQWLLVDPEVSAGAFEDMRHFLQLITEPDLRDRIGRTLPEVPFGADDAGR